MLFNSKLKQKEKELNSYFNNYKDFSDFNEVRNNIDFLQSICMDLYSVITHKGYIDIPQDFNYNSTKTSYSDNIKNVEDFYKSIGINIDIKKMEKEGKVSIFNKDDTISGDISKSDVGSCCTRGSGKNATISLINTGKFLDSIVTVHELAHALDKESTNGLNALLGETKAISIEFIYSNNFKDKYSDDVIKFQRIRINAMAFSISRAFEFCEYIKIYNMPGGINRRNYHKKYPKGNYEKFLEYGHVLMTLIPVQSFSYLLAAYLSPYISKNIDMKNVKELLSTYNNMNDFYKFNNIDDSYESHKKLISAFSEFVDETLEEKNTINK